MNTANTINTVLTDAALEQVAGGASKSSLELGMATLAARQAGSGFGPAGAPGALETGSMAMGGVTVNDHGRSRYIFF